VVRQHIGRSEFERLVEEALAELPPNFAKLLHNVAVVVEDEPSEDDLGVMEDDAYEAGHELLGLYRGTPLTRRTHDMIAPLPDTVAIFRGPILRVTASRREAVEQVRDTVVHELGHYFGLADHEMPY
jgi:predicted Zn-dependent protease with MMP-like domain